MSRDSLDDVRSNRYHGEAVGSLWALVGSFVGIVLYLVFAWIVIHHPLTSDTPLRFVVAVPLLLFLPGYAFLSALFPSREERTLGSGGPLSRTARFDTIQSIEQRGITWSERLALSFGMSLVWLPLLALVLAVTPWGLELTPIFGIVSAFVLGWSAVGTVWRARLPPSERFVVPYRRWLIDARTAFGRSPADALLTGVLALSVLAAAASLTYALAVPTDATGFTEFGIGTVNESGQLTYTAPPNFTQGEPRNVTVLIENHEEQAVNYTVVVQIQEVESADEGVTVLDRQEVDRFSTALPANESTQVTRSITPGTTGENLRLTFLLYRGEPPASPTVDNAYRHTYYWIDVAG